MQRCVPWLKLQGVSLIENWKHCLIRISFAWLVGAFLKSSLMTLPALAVFQFHDAIWAYLRPHRFWGQSDDGLDQFGRGTRHDQAFLLHSRLVSAWNTSCRSVCFSVCMCVCVTITLQRGTSTTRCAYYKCEAILPSQKQYFWRPVRQWRDSGFLDVPRPGQQGSTWNSASHQWGSSTRKPRRLERRGWHYYTLNTSTFAIFRSSNSRKDMIPATVLNPLPLACEQAVNPLGRSYCIN